MTAQPDTPSPDTGSYEVIHLGGQAAVVVPVTELFAATESTISRSMSVVVRDKESFSARSSTLARIGMVFRRSTTLCTWLSERSRSARSIVNFMGKPLQRMYAV